MDGVDPGTVHAAEHLLADVPEVQVVDEVRMRWLGHALHAEVNLTVSASLTLSHAHRTAHLAEEELIREIPKLRTATVHAYPAHADAYPWARGLTR